MKPTEPCATPGRPASRARPVDGPCGTTSSPRSSSRLAVAAYMGYAVRTGLPAAAPPCVRWPPSGSPRSCPAPCSGGPCARVAGGSSRTWPWGSPSASPSPCHPGRRRAHRANGGSRWCCPLARRRWRCSRSRRRAGASGPRTWAPIAVVARTARPSLVSLWALRQLVAYFRTNEVTWTGPWRAPHRRLPAPGPRLPAPAPRPDELAHRGGRGPRLPLVHPRLAGPRHGCRRALDSTSSLLRVMPALMPPHRGRVRHGGRASASRGSAKVASARQRASPWARRTRTPFGAGDGGSCPSPRTHRPWLSASPPCSPSSCCSTSGGAANCPRAGYLLVPLLSVIAAGTKGATSPLVVAGLGLAVVAMFVWNRRLLRQVARRPARRRRRTGLRHHRRLPRVECRPRASACPTRPKQTYLFGALGALPSPGCCVAAAVLVILGGLTRAALAFAPLLGRRSRREPMPWLLAGGSLAGAGAVGLFSHPGLSQGYFLSTAIPLAALGSALGARVLVRALGPALGGQLLPWPWAPACLIYLAPTRLAGRREPRSTYGIFWTSWSWPWSRSRGRRGRDGSWDRPGRRWTAALATVAMAGMAVGRLRGPQHGQGAALPAGRATRPP